LLSQATEDKLLRPIAFLAHRLAAFSSLGILAAGCSTTGTSSVATVPGTASTQSTARGTVDRRASEGLVRPPAHAANTRPGWISPDKSRHKKSLIYWGDYDHNSIDIFSAKGTNPPVKGQITSGLSNPERLFVDKALNVYATNLGNSTITAYKRGATTPFLTISNGVNYPTGLTVDAAGTVYCANFGSDTVTEYPKGQTSPSLTISISSPEYLAIDKSDNLYVSTGLGVTEFAPGATTGKGLGLTIGSPGALEVDKAGNIIVIDQSANTIDVFPAGQTAPSKQIAVTAGLPFALSLNKAENVVYVTVGVSGGFVVQDLAYPNGTTLSNKLTTITDGEWPIAVSPDAVL
jgi:hypothetical protein